MKLLYTRRLFVRSLHLPLYALFTAVLAAAALAAPLRIDFTGYSVLYDPSAQGMRANSAYAVLTQGTLELVFTGPIEDDEAGTLPFVTETRDWGKSWSKPRVFGAEMPQEFLIRIIGPLSSSLRSDLRRQAPRYRSDTALEGV